MDFMTTWHKLISMEFQKNRENWCDVEHSTLTWDELNIKFDDESTLRIGQPFTIWTRDRVYFPVQVRNKQIVASVSRIVDRLPTLHIGRDIF